MWLIPSNLPPSSAFAPAFVASNEELTEHWDSLSESPLMWKSKPLSSKTFWLAWKRVWWMQHLYGRILKPSLTSRFTESYTASLAAIPASPSAWPASKKENTTLDTFGRILNSSWAQLDLFGVSLKTSPVISQLGSTKFMQAFETWVTQLRQAYTVRAKRAHHTNANASLSSLSTEISWSTPRGGGQEDYETRLARGKDMGLQGQVKFLQKTKWATPDASPRGTRAEDLVNGNSVTRRESGQIRGIDLQTQVKHWKTPTSHETEGGIMKELYGDAKYKLRDQVNWGTSNTMDSLPSRSYAAMKHQATNGGRKNRQRPSNLREQIDPLMLKAYQDAQHEANQTPQLSLHDLIADHYNPETTSAHKWPTPASRDYKGANSEEHLTKGIDDRNHLGQLPNYIKLYGQLPRDMNNTSGNNPAHWAMQHAYHVLYETCGVVAGRILRKCWEKKYGRKLTTTSKQLLNPNWVLQLMGTTSEKTFFVPLAMEWWNKQPKSPLEILSENSDLAI